MFGLFDPPRLKAQKAAAKQARLMRGLAAREVAIELQMLAKCIRVGTGHHQAAYAAGKEDMATRYVIALGDAQECMNDAGFLISNIQWELDNTYSQPERPDDFEALTTFEIEARNALVLLRDRAKVHLGTVGTLNVEAVWPQEQIAK